MISQGTFNPVEAIKMKKEQEAQQLFKESEMLFTAAEQAKSFETPETINTQKTKQDSQNSFIENKTKEEVKVTFENLPPGTKVEGNGGNNFAMPQLGTTSN